MRSDLPPQDSAPTSSDQPGVPPLLPTPPGTQPPRLPGPVIVEGRLHPLSLLFRAGQIVGSVIIPAVVFIALRGERATGIIMLALVLIPLTLALIRYFTFTYRIEAGELIIRQGLLGRTERNIPLSRVQDIRVEQNLLHRLFRLADVQIDTAGSQGPEASLSVLSLVEADRLRQMLFEQVPARRATEGRERTGQESEHPELLRAVSLRELVIGGLTSNKLASVMAMVVVVERILSNFLPPDRYQKLLGRFIGDIEQWAHNGGESAWWTVALGAAALLLVGMVLSVMGSVINFHGFTLTRVGEDLHRSYGLFTRRSSSLPRDRIQALQVEEKPLRRLFRLATLRADTAGAQTPSARGQSGGRDVLLPIVPRNEVDGLLPAFFPDWRPEEASWCQVSRRAIYRGTVKGALLCCAISAGLILNHPVWSSLWPLGFIPLAYLLSVMSFKHLGYGLGSRYFRTRRGWISRSTHVVPIRNAQSIVLRQNPFDRRHRVRSLEVDTAGQAYTGGGPRIDNVPEEEALSLAWTLARRAAATRYGRKARG